MIKEKNKNFGAIFYAILAAILFGINAPFAKLLLAKITPTLLASLLYFGAGFGMSLIYLIQKAFKIKKEESPLTKKQLPYTIMMVLLDILAPILLMIGLNKTTSANASLLNNFEIVATSIIALFIFKEKISKKLWVAIILITISTIILSIEDVGSFSFSIGSLFVILACICWGIENNCTRVLSSQDPLQIVIIKGLGAGLGAFIVSCLLGFKNVEFIYLILGLILGFVSYGLSIFFYVYSQRYLGASKTSAFYAFAPFIGAGISLLVFQQIPNLFFIVALLIMLVGAFLGSTDYHKHLHTHEAITHEHVHSHDDGHHNHVHSEEVKEHSHVHTHEVITHNHIHMNDLHHSHSH